MVYSVFMIDVVVFGIVGVVRSSTLVLIGASVIV